MSRVGAMARSVYPFPLKLSECRKAGLSRQAVATEIPGPDSG